MGLLALYFDVTSKVLRRGLQDEDVFLLPDLHQEDSPTIELNVIKRNSYDALTQHFSRVSLSGYSLQISVGSAASVLASQNVFTLSGDGYTLSGAVGLNTAGINALADGTTQIFEIRLSDGTNFYRLQTSCVIKKSVALAASLSVPATDTALGRIEAASTYIPSNDARSFTMLSLPNGSKRFLVYFHDDGSFRTEEIV